MWLNGRDVGLYVLKEGFDARFLGRHFPRSEGNLYDGGFAQDIDANLTKETGKGPDDRGDLYALALAAREPNAAKRWTEVGERLDIDSFVTFMALERNDLPLGWLLHEREQLPRLLRPRAREDGPSSCRTAWTRCSAIRAWACSINRIR